MISVASSDLTVGESVKIDVRTFRNDLNDNKVNVMIQLIKNKITKNKT